LGRPRDIDVNRDGLGRTVGDLERPVAPETKLLKDDGLRSENAESMLPREGRIWIWYRDFRIGLETDG
jgi:hypothetical protein